jgi:putative tricarboxylic transport membrane protein
LGKLGNTITCLFFFTFGVGFAVGGVALKLGTLMEPGPGFFPFFGGIILDIVVALLFFQTYRLQGEGKGDPRMFLGPLMVIAALFFALAIFERLGYIVAMAIVSLTILYVLKAKPLWLAIVVSILFAGSSYLIFDYLLSVPLPLGILA